MELIENNPFRVLGLPVTASVREIEKRASELETYAAMGKPKAYDTDFKLSPVLRTSENVIESRKKLQLAEDKFRTSLFWFWSSNSVDELAFDLLRDGNLSKAVAIWEKAVFSNKEESFVQVPVADNLITASSGWPDLDNDDHRIAIEADVYVIEQKNTKTAIATTMADFDDSERWLIECDVEWMAGVDDCAFGMVFGRRNNSYFSFEIAATGFYRFGRTVNWSFESIIEWTEVDDEVIAGYELNHFQVEREVDHVILRINGFELAKIPREPFFGSSIGFKVSGEQTVHFTNLKLSKFEVDKSYANGIKLTNKNFSCAKNLALLHLYRSVSESVLTSEYWVPAVSLFEKFASSDYFDEYVRAVGGSRFVPDWSDTIDYYTRALVEAIKPSLDKPSGITTREFIDSFSVFPDKNFKAVKDLFVARSIQTISNAVEVAERHWKVDASKAVSSGKELISAVELEISRLSSNLGKSSIEYQLASDKVVDALVQCVIDHSHAVFDPVQEMPLLEYGAAIAVTPRSIERVTTNLRMLNLAVAESEIRNLIEKTRSSLERAPRDAIRIGEEFIDASAAHLSAMRKFAKGGTDEYKRVADAVSGTVTQCAIAHFNATKNDEPGVHLYKRAVDIAVSFAARKYALENLSSCEAWIKNKDYMLCYFCRENEPQIETSIPTTMFLETSRTRLLNSTSVEYSCGDVVVPRCLNCKSVHEAITSYKVRLFFSSLGGSLAGFIGGALIYPHFKNVISQAGMVLPVDGWSFVFVSVISAGVIGGLLAYLLIPRVDRGNVRSKHDVNGFPVIHKRLSEGWTFSKPSA